MEIILPILTSFFAFIVIITLITYTVRIIPQSNAYVVERLGAYHRTLQTGLHFVIPILDRVAGHVSLKEQVYDFAPQPVITKDNVTMMIDTVVYFQILDPKLYVYGVVRPIQAIENLSATTLRNIIGDLELDETLTSREIINTKMRVILDEATDPWGIKVGRVEVKNILPPKDIQEAMEKQMRAEREKRAMVLQSEGARDAAINNAEGEKQQVIKASEAKKQQQINEAEGQSAAILLVAQATSEGIQKVAESINIPGGFEAVQLKVAEQYVEKFGQLAKQNNTMILPTNLADIAGFVSGAMAAIKKTQA